MTTFDVMRFAGDALRQHRRRSLLSLLGVAIGIVAVISLTALGEGARRYVLGQFSSLGSNLLIVMPGKNETTGIPGPGGTPNDLTLEDALAIEREIFGVRKIVPISLMTAGVEYRQRTRQSLVIGTTTAFASVRELQMDDGRFLPEGDIRDRASVVVLGRTVARELFEEASPIGQPVRVGGYRMRVIGVVAARGEQMGLDMDEAVIIPVASGLQISNRASLVRILVEMRPGDDMDGIKAQALALLTERHDDEEDVTIITQEAVLGALSRILVVLTGLLVGIAAISLTVAGIGIMNVMLVSVSERTAEVGLMKALGATRRQILAIFLIEAILLSATGGATGLLVGWALVELAVFLYPALPAAAPLWAVGAVLGVSLFTGTVFGVLPAWRAARLDPVSALAGH